MGVEILLVTGTASVAEEFFFVKKKFFVGAGILLVMGAEHAGLFC